MAKIIIELDTDKDNVSDVLRLLMPQQPANAERVAEVLQPGPVEPQEHIEDPIPTRVTGGTYEPPVLPDYNERDSAGALHDDRIHAASRAKNADGTWRKRRGATEVVTDAHPFVPSPPPAPTPVPPPPPPVPTSRTVQDLLQAITAALASDKLSAVQVADACQSLGLDRGVVGLATRPDLVQPLAEVLGV